MGPLIRPKNSGFISWGGLDWGTGHDLRVGGFAGTSTCKQTHASNIIMASTKSNHHDVEETIICFLSWRNSMSHFHLNV